MSPHHTPSLSSGLMWFRRDLRAHDNHALYQALSRCAQVHAVFVFDRDILDPLPRADRRVEFIRESLVALDAELHALGAQTGETVHLAVLHGHEILYLRNIVEQDAAGEVKCEATVKLHIDGERIISTAEGNGPVNALDRAMRRAIVQKYPDLDTLRLVDYKVRILDEKGGTGAKTRVLIGTSNGRDEWSTVGVHENVIAASWRALEDAVKYGLLKRDR